MIKKRRKHPKSPSSHSDANEAGIEIKNDPPTLSKARIKFCEGIGCIHYVGKKCVVDGTLDESECIQSAVCFFKWIIKRYKIVPRR